MGGINAFSFQKRPDWEPTHHHPHSGSKFNREIELIDPFQCATRVEQVAVKEACQPFHEESPINQHESPLQLQLSLFCAVWLGSCCISCACRIEEGMTVVVRDRSYGWCGF